MGIPVVAIHLINDKPYKYHTYSYEDITYKYHTICEPDEATYYKVSTESIDYTPTLIDIEDSEYDNAYRIVRELIDENVGWDKFLGDSFKNDNNWGESDEWNYDSYEDWEEYELM